MGWRSPFRFRSPEDILASARRPLEREESISQAINRLQSFRFARRQFRPSPSPSGQFLDRFGDVTGPFTGRTETLRPPRPPAIRPLTAEEEAAYPALAEALGPQPGLFERVGTKALSTVGKGYEELQRRPLLGGPVAETEGPGTSAAERFQTRF